MTIRFVNLICVLLSVVMIGIWAKWSDQISAFLGCISSIGRGSAAMVDQWFGVLGLVYLGYIALGIHRFLGENAARNYDRSTK